MNSQPLTQKIQAFAHEFTLAQAILLVVGVWLASQILLFLYRLTLHPLAKFPGPKLAAGSYWYECYYDVLKEGKFIWKIQELHRKYGDSLR